VLRNYLKKQLARPIWTQLASFSRAGRFLVLCYHNICEDSAYRSWLRVRRSEFESHLRFFLSIGSFITPGELETVLRNEGGPGKNSPLRFLLTFDDGYENNFCLGLPILEKLGVPAVFFVSTRPLSTGSAFWHDRVIEPIQTLRFRKLDLRREGLRKYHFPEPDDEKRWDSIQQLLEDIKSLQLANSSSFSRVLQILDRIAAKANIRLGADCRPLDIATLSQMAANHLCHIGSHAHEHNLLTSMSDPELSADLQKSKDILHSVTGNHTSLFAYPNGSVNDRVMQAVRNAGFKLAFTTASGMMRGNTSPYLIPRLLVGGYSPIHELRLGVNRCLLNI
jgi:peptidoglycan/xylan/chitin deacetylase (PgdA/CDA1 family)